MINKVLQSFRSQIFAVPFPKGRDQNNARFIENLDVIPSARTWTGQTGVDIEKTIDIGTTLGERSTCLAGQPCPVNNQPMHAW